MSKSGNVELTSPFYEQLVMFDVKEIFDIPFPRPDDEVFSQSSVPEFDLTAMNYSFEAFGCEGQDATAVADRPRNVTITDGKFFKLAPDKCTANTAVAYCVKCEPERVAIKGRGNSSSNFICHLKRKHGQQAVREYSHYLRQKRSGLRQLVPAQLIQTVFDTVPQQQQQQSSPSSPSPVPIAPKKIVVPPSAPPQPPPAPPEVCLRWNSYHSNMQATFPSLLNNEQFVDVTLACEGRSIKCHKVMLSACSSYFEELLSQNPCQHPIIFMRDLKFWEVQALVEFMYSGEVNVAQDRLPSLLAAAEALHIKGLTGPSAGSSSHDEDSLPIPEIEESPTPAHLQKRVRKRKIPTTPIFQPVNKTQVFGHGQITPAVKQIKVPVNIPSHSMPSTSYVAPHPREPLHQHQPVKIKREHSPPATIKNETVELPTDYSIDQGDSDTGQSNEHEVSSVDRTNITIEPGPIQLTMKAQQQDNGLSEEEQTASSDCSDDRYQTQMQTEPGENGGTA